MINFAASSGGSDTLLEVIMCAFFHLLSLLLAFTERNRHFYICLSTAADVGQQFSTSLMDILDFVRARVSLVIERNMNI